MLKMPKKEPCLDELKKRYKAIQGEYKLPDFAYLNENFEIEKLAENETDFLLREIREIILEKAVAYLRFIEMLLNPSSAPMFFFSLVKGLSADDKKVIERLYENLIEFEIIGIELSNEYSEKREAEFIKNIRKEWDDVKGDMGLLTNSIKLSWKIKKEKSGREYFG